MRRCPSWLWIRFACVVAATALFFLVPPAEAKSVLKATILHINDVHGHYEPYRDGKTEQLVGGYGKAASLIDRIRAENRGQGRTTFLLNAGDLLTGTPLDAATKGTLGIKLMNMMGFDAMAVGNHEFDLGWAQFFQTLAPMAGFPLLSANMRTSACPQPPIQAAMEPPVEHGTRTVVFGLTTRDAKTKTKKVNVEGVDFLDEIETATELLKRYKDEDFVIALTHIGFDVDKRLAESAPKIDVIVGGHSHTRLTSPYRENEKSAVIVQAGACGRYLGRLDVEVVDGRVIAYSGELMPLDADVPEKPEIARLIDQAKTALPETYAKVIGRTDVTLVGGCRGEGPEPRARLDKLVTYVIAESLGTPALINSGTVRASLNKGEITAGDVETALPFRGSIPVTVQLTGAQLAEALQKSAGQRDYGTKLQTVGIAYKVEGSKVKIARVGDAAFQPDRTYAVTINDYLAQGGDEYGIFTGKPAKEGPKLIKDLVTEFIQNRGVITPELVQSIR